jgi:hypothetical protein
LRKRRFPFESDQEIQILPSRISLRMQPLETLPDLETIARFPSIESPRDRTISHTKYTKPTSVASGRTRESPNAGERILEALGYPEKVTNFASADADVAGQDAKCLRRCGAGVRS